MNERTKQSHSLRKDFLEEMRKVSHSHDEIDIFRDCCRVFAISLRVPLLQSAEERNSAERQYQNVVSKYGKEGMEHIAKCFSIVCLALEEKREDFLGHLLEELNGTSKGFSQFFTPPHVARLMSSIVGGDKPKVGELVTLADPCCGAGVLLIEYGETHLENGGRQCDLFISAEDIDETACCIAYTQLSLLGFSARITHMDSLSKKIYDEPWFTVGFYLHGTQWRIRPRGNEEPQKILRLTQGELSLFNNENKER